MDWYERSDKIDILNINIKRVHNILVNYTDNGKHNDHVWELNDRQGRVVKLWNGPEGKFCADLGESTRTIYIEDKTEFIGRVISYLFQCVHIYVDRAFEEHTNQAWRSTYVLKVNKTRFRVEFEMTGSTRRSSHRGEDKTWYQQGWRDASAVVDGIQFYYPKGK